MKHDDVATIESLLIKMVDSLTSALGDATQIRAVLDARRRRGEYGPRTDSGPPDLIDDSRLTVRWNGGECHLGSTVLFRLFCRLARPANRYVSVDRLLADVWGYKRSEDMEVVWGEKRTEDTTVRSAVRNLRRKLEEAGMAELADAIKGQPGQYRLLLDGVARKD